MDRSVFGDRSNIFIILMAVLIIILGAYILTGI